MRTTAVAAWWASERRTPLIFVLKAACFLVSFAAAALILTFIDFERSYDAWNPDAARIARAVETRDLGSGTRYTSLPYPFADAARAELPGVVAAARVQPLRAMVQRGRDRFNETLFFAEPSFLEIFPVAIAAGAAAPLAESNALVISERAAKKYFGTDDPIGKTLALGGARDVKVAAVMRDWPAASHIRPDFLLSLDTFFGIAASGGIPRAALTGWGNCHCYVTYLLFDSAGSLARARQAVPPLVAERRDAGYLPGASIGLQPLLDVYLGSSGYSSYLDHASVGDPTELAVFASAAALLLLIAALCFANFSTAQASARARELAMRRLLGARPSGIAARMTIESAATAVCTAAAGIGVAAVLVGPFGRFVDRPIELATLLQPSLLAQLAAVALIVGACSGIGLSLAVARIPATALLQGRLAVAAFGVSGAAFRKGLVALQFVASFVLIVFALAIHSELAFVRAETRLGYDPRGLLVLNAEGADAELADLEARLIALPGVRSVSIANSVPTTPLPQRVSVALGRGGASRPLLLNRIDFGYFGSLGVRVLAGRGFDPAFGADGAAGAELAASAVINETAVSELGFVSKADAIGQVLRFSDQDAGPSEARIIGVVDDIRYGGPRQAVDPLLYLVRTDWNVNRHQQSYLLVAADRTDARLMARIGEAWNDAVPGFVARVDRLEDRVADQTESERRELRLIAAFAVAAMALSVFGILGFAALAMKRAARGLAIRRVFGATRGQVAAMVSGGQLRIVAAALAIGCPIALWLTSRWLDAFVLRAPIDPSWFLMSGAALAAVAFGAVAMLIFRLTRESPLEHVRRE
ncbi:MAG TPA: ABC transporter permease [Gammaproteobacteria bacterium]|nr:ABC transporter permease [Gammaproteobacteria bacterium]